MWSCLALIVTHAQENMSKSIWTPKHYTLINRHPIPKSRSQLHCFSPSLEGISLDFITWLHGFSPIQPPKS